LAFSLGKAPHARAHFAGLDALIKQEQTAAKGMSDVARATHDMTQGFQKLAQASSQAADEAARAVSVRSGSGSGGGSGGGSAMSASVADTSGVEGGLSAVGDQMTVLGLRMRAAMEAALIPLNSMGAAFSAQFNAVAGTVTEMARRIDSSMKFPKWDKFRKDAADMFLSVASATKGRIGALGAYMIGTGYGVIRVWGKVGNFLSSTGDVAAKGLDKLAKTNLARTAADARRVGSGLRSVSPAADAAVGSVRNLGREIAVSLGVFGLVYKLTSAVKDFFVGGIKGASDLNEVTSAAEVTFGKFAPIVARQADEMARLYGLSKRTQIESATGFGEMAKGAGYAQKASAEFGNTFTKLASDLSSRKNIPFAEAAGKIQSALAGQAEPLRVFGVLIDEDAVKAQALAMGLSGSAKHLDNHSKMAARAALIQRGLSSANGDLARTAGDAANQFRMSGGGLNNFAVSIGQVFLPAVKSGTQAFNDLLSSVVEVFEANRPLIESWGASLKQVMDGVGVGVRNVGSYWTIFKLSAMESLSNTLAYIEVMPARLGQIGEWIGNNWSKLITDAVNAVALAFVHLSDYIGDLGKAAFAWLSDPMGGFQAPDWTPLLDGFKATADQLPELLKPNLISMRGEIDAEFEKIRAKEAARAAGLKSFGARQDGLNPLAPATAGVQDKGPQFADVAHAGSKEAYSAIIRHGAGGSDDPGKAIAKNTEKVADEAARTNDFLDKILHTLGLNNDGSDAAFDF
jgi:hypothetical protein